MLKLLISHYIYFAHCSLKFYEFLQLMLKIVLYFTDLFSFNSELLFYYAIFFCYIYLIFEIIYNFYCNSCKSIYL